MEGEIFSSKQQKGEALSRHRLISHIRHSLHRLIRISPIPTTRTRLPRTSETWRNHSRRFSPRGTQRPLPPSTTRGALPLPAHPQTGKNPGSHERRNQQHRSGLMNVIVFTHSFKPFSSKQPLTTLASGTLPILTHQQGAIRALDLRISRRFSSVITGPHVQQIPVIPRGHRTEVDRTAPEPVSLSKCKVARGVIRRIGDVMDLRIVSHTLYKERCPHQCQ